MATIKELADAMRGCDQDLRGALVAEARATARRWRGLARRLGLPNDQALALHRAATAEAAACDQGPLAAVAEAMGVTAVNTHYWARKLGGPPRPKPSRWDGSAAERDAEAARVYGLLAGGMTAGQVRAEMGYRALATVYGRRDRHLAAMAARGEAALPPPRAARRKRRGRPGLGEEAGRVLGMLEGGMTAGQVRAEMGYRALATVYSRRRLGLALAAEEGKGKGEGREEGGG